MELMGVIFALKFHVTPEVKFVFIPNDKLDNYKVVLIHYMLDNYIVLIA